ncbi:MAG: hypothetical protein Q8R35_03575 [bacterium]|nr:hypothetical protein [bacterium]
MARALNVDAPFLRRQAAGRVRLPNGRQWLHREFRALCECIRIMASYEFTPREIALLTGHTATTIYIYNQLYHLGIPIRPYRRIRSRWQRSPA